MTVFVVCHKANPLPVKLDSSYKKLYVGKITANHPNDGFCETSGRNISDRNSEYSELTGMYWIWKNFQSPVKGLIHYRRYFLKRKQYLGLTKVISGKGINRLLRSYDCIVPEKLIFNYSVKKHYEKCHLLSDWKLLGEVIEARCPQYGHDFIDIGEQYWMYPYNMIIAKQKVFDAYCEWLFPILDDLYGIIDVSDRDAYQKRAIGFLSERLMALWLIHNNVSLVERPVMQIE